MASGLYHHFISRAVIVRIVPLQGLYLGMTSGPVLGTGTLLSYEGSGLTVGRERGWESGTKKLMLRETLES